MHFVVKFVINFVGLGPNEFDKVYDKIYDEVTVPC